MDTNKLKFGSKCGKFAMITSGRNPVEFHVFEKKEEGFV